MIEGFARQQARIIVGSNMCVPTEFFANQYSKNPFKPCAVFAWFSLPLPFFFFLHSLLA